MTGTKLSSLYIFIPAQLSAAFGFLFYLLIPFYVDEGYLLNFIAVTTQFHLFRFFTRSSYLVEFQPAAVVQDWSIILVSSVNMFLTNVAILAAIFVAEDLFFKLDWLIFSTVSVFLVIAGQAFNHIETLLKYSESYKFFFYFCILRNFGFWGAHLYGLIVLGDPFKTFFYAHALFVGCNFCVLLYFFLVKCWGKIASAVLQSWSVVELKRAVDRKILIDTYPSIANLDKVILGAYSLEFLAVYFLYEKCADLTSTIYKSFALPPLVRSFQSSSLEPVNVKETVVWESLVVVAIFIGTLSLFSLAFVCAQSVENQIHLLGLVLFKTTLNLLAYAPLERHIQRGFRDGYERILRYSLVGMSVLLSLAVRVESESMILVALALPSLIQFVIVRATRA